MRMLRISRRALLLAAKMPVSGDIAQSSGQNSILLSHYFHDERQMTTGDAIRRLLWLH